MKVTITITGPQGSGKSAIGGAITAYLTGLGCVVKREEEITVPLEFFLKNKPQVEIVESNTARVDAAKLDAALVRMRASVGEYLQPKQPGESVEAYEIREHVGEVVGFHLANVEKSVAK